jgi:hypothetical protein
LLGSYARVQAIENSDDDEIKEYRKPMRKSQLEKNQGDSIQAVIELYKKDVDRALIRHNLKLTVEERLLNLQNFNQFAEEFRNAGKKLRKTLKAGANE